MTSRFFTTKFELQKLFDFNDWLGEISAPMGKIIIAGNHDTVCQDQGTDNIKSLITNGTYLENEMIKIGSITLFATPLSSGRSGNKAFQSQEYAATAFKEAPPVCDILLTHGLCPEIEQKVEHKIKIWGHHHSCYGIHFKGDVVKGVKVLSGISVCSPMMTKYYGLKNPPIVIDVPSDLCGVPVSTGPVTRQNLQQGIETKQNKVTPI